MRSIIRNAQRPAVSSDAYGIFIDSGSPDSYLSGGSADVNSFLNESFFNGTYNLSSTPILNGSDINGEEDVAELIIMAVTSVLLGLMILITVIGKWLGMRAELSFFLYLYYLLCCSGNVFVIAAIILERNLQNVANYLVASLAVADLLVACLVMPLGAVYEVCIT